MRYVGSTLCLKERRKVHYAAHGASSKEHWIHELHEAGLEPVMEVITTCKPNQRYVVEDHYVSQLRSAGHKLLNEKKVPVRFKSAQTRDRVRKELIAGAYELVAKVRNSLYTVRVPSGAVYSVYGGLHTRSKYYYVFVNEHKYHVPRSVWIYKSPPDERYFHKSPWMCGYEDRKAKAKGVAK